MKNCRCIIRGCVQGVWFRRYTQNVAEELGISGWVRNREDGSVEVEASVPDELFDDFIAALRKGPPLAHVEDIEIAEIPHSYSGGFEVRG